ncbi:MAG: hypothetical protein ACTHX2_13815 [Microbacterium sp.]
MLKEAERIQLTKLSFGKAAFDAWCAEAQAHWGTVLDVQKRRGGAALEKQVQLVGARRQKTEHELERYVIESKLREEQETRTLKHSVDRRKKASKPPVSDEWSRRRPSPAEKQEIAARNAARAVLAEHEEWNPDYGADHRAEARRAAVSSRLVQQPEEGRPKPNLHWIGLLWTEIRGEAHVVTPVKLTFCGLGAESGDRGYTAPVCYECGAFARMEPGLRSERLPTRVAEAIKRWEATKGKRRSGNSSSVRSVSGGLPSMGKRYS